jgi:hypothetical protein
MTPELEVETEAEVYAVVILHSDPDAKPGTEPRMEWVEAWPRTAEGAIMASTRAARLSRGGEPHEVHRPDGRMLGRWVGGRRADLPPGGLIHMHDAKAAGDDL